MNIIETLRKNVIDDLFHLGTVNNHWHIWSEQLREIIGPNPSAQSVLNIGDNLSSVFEEDEAADDVDSEELEEDVLETSETDDEEANEENSDANVGKVLFKAKPVDGAQSSFRSLDVLEREAEYRHLRVLDVLLCLDEALHTAFRDILAHVVVDPPSC